MTTVEELKAKLAKRLLKRRAILGKQGCTKTHFGEQYVIHFQDGTYVDVYVWTEHGFNEKDQHGLAEQIARENFPNLEIKWVDYA